LLFIVNVFNPRKEVKKMRMFNYLKIVAKDLLIIASMNIMVVEIRKIVDEISDQIEWRRHFRLERKNHEWDNE